MDIQNINSNLHSQITVRIPPRLYEALKNYITESELNISQITIYALASYLGKRKMQDLSAIASQVSDLKIDIQDLEFLLEQLDRRVSKLEPKPSKIIGKYRLTDMDKRIILDYIKSGYSIKQCLIRIKQNPDDQSLQQQVARLLRANGWNKYRRKAIDGTLAYVWVKND